MLATLLFSSPNRYFRFPRNEHQARAGRRRNDTILLQFDCNTIIDGNIIIILSLSRPFESALIIRHKDVSVGAQIALSDKKTIPNNNNNNNIAIK